MTRLYIYNYDGAEVSELVGLLILSKLSNLVEKSEAGLYRDDGLLFLRNANGRRTDITRKEIIRVFKSIGFQIEIATNLKSVNFLDVTLDLNTGTHCPYKKPNDTLLYVHTSSNHPQQILKQLPKSINDRLSRNSSNKTIFEKSKLEYEEALRKSGYEKPILSFQPTKTTVTKRNRPRNITWFNPPFNKNVSSNVAKTFLKLIDKHFSTASNLHKIFNRNTVKVSYSSTENVERIIKSHNKSLQSPAPVTLPPCNCRKKYECPLDGNCRASSILYKCEATTPNFPKKVYIGLTEKEFKTRYTSHKQSINNKKYAHSTTLSSYVWDMKEKHKITPSLKWSILRHVKSY